MRTGPREILTFALLFVVTAVSAASLHADVVERRGVEPVVEGKVIGVDDAGVSLRAESGAAYFVPWDRVRRVVSDPPVPTLRQHMVIATDLWRARSRVERGDTVLAEPLFQRLFEKFRGQNHVTALVVAEGLLRCRLARGANALAVIPALETARLRRAGTTTVSYAGLPPVLDDVTSLSPQLAPAWLNSRTLVKLERDLSGYDANGDTVIEAIARRYLVAARRQLGFATAGESDENSKPTDDPAAAHPGVSLLTMLEDCYDPVANKRDDARRRLEREIQSLADSAARSTNRSAEGPTRRSTGDSPGGSSSGSSSGSSGVGPGGSTRSWIESWAHFALGTSLVSERGVRQRLRGMVHLVHIPARHDDDLPFLSGLALAWLAEANRVDGDPDVASTMEAELDRRFPNHPARTLDHPVRLPPTEASSR